MRKTIITLCLIGIVFLIIGCTSLITDYRKDGFKAYSMSFALVSDTLELYKIIKIKNIEVHIVGDRSKFIDKRARLVEKGVVGYATAKNGVYQIWLFGKIVNGKVIVNQAVLGHEFNHILKYVDKSITNPDKLDELGM